MEASALMAPVTSNWARSRRSTRASSTMGVEVGAEVKPVAEVKGEAGVEAGAELKVDPGVEP